MRVTTPRIFSYGSIEEFDAMITKLMQIYPKTKFFCVGFSLGANIVTNFMASLTNDMLPHFLVGLSVCQGYDAEK
jgi:predicted alpha/beta-fold hydrolase